MFNFPDQATVKNVVHSLPRVGVGTSYGLPQARWVNVLTNQQETDNTYKSTFTLPSAIHVQAATFDERSTLYAQTCVSASKWEHSRGSHLHVTTYLFYNRFQVLHTKGAAVEQALKVKPGQTDQGLRFGSGVWMVFPSIYVPTV